MSKHIFTKLIHLQTGYCLRSDDEGSVSELVRFGPVSVDYAKVFAADEGLEYVQESN